MGCILIAMPKYEDANRLADIIKRSEIWQETFVCTTGNEILRRIADQDVSIVIATKKLSDMGYEELSTYLPVSVNMILLTKDGGLVPFSSNVIRLLMPFKSEDLLGTIRMLSPELFSKPKKKPARTKEEILAIERAKEILISQKHMTEPEAFRYLQKTSMDTGRTLVESAQMILAFNGESS